MPLEPWTRGIYNAAAAFGGGDAVEEAAYQQEKDRLLRQANAQATIDNKLLRQKLLSAEVDALANLHREIPPEVLNTVVARRGADYSAAMQGRQREAAFDASGDAFEAMRNGDWGLGMAYKAAYAPGPSPVAAVQGDVVVGNRYLPGGGTIATTPIGDSKVAANNALAQQRQVGAKVAADKADTSIAGAKALTAEREAKAALARAKLAQKGGDPAIAFSGAVDKMAEAQETAAKFVDRLAGKQGQTTPTGRSQTEVRTTEATKQAELRAASRSPTGEAFGVSEPTIEPDAPLTPDLGVGAVADLMTPARAAAPAGKPPVKGAKLSPRDGKWYVRRNGKMYEVE